MISATLGLSAERAQMVKVIIDKSPPDELPKGCEYPARVDDLVACLKEMRVNASHIGASVYMTRGSWPPLNSRADRYSLCRISYYPEPSRMARRPWDDLASVAECDLWLDAIPQKAAKAAGLTRRALPQVLRSSLPALGDAINAGIWLSIRMVLSVGRGEIACEYSGQRTGDLPSLAQDTTFRIADL